MFEREIRAKLPADAEPRAFIAIDIETGDFEVDESGMEAADRLEARNPEVRGRIFLRRVGSEVTYRMGRRFHSETATPHS